MEFEQVLEIINTAKFSHCEKHLSDVEAAILRGVWQSQTYEKIAENAGYSVSYLSQSAGPQLWMHLSQALGEPVSKKNFRTAIERHWLKIARSRGSIDSKHPYTLHSQHISSSQNHSENLSRPQQHFDWGNAVDVRQFYGRTEELTTLTKWIQVDRSQLIALLGMGGIGKTTLTIKLAEQVQSGFNYIIWRSLRNAPSITDLLLNIIQSISGRPVDELPSSFDDLLSTLVTYLRSSRCLIIFDNLESVLKSNDRTGCYQKNHEAYEQLFNCIADTKHNSCLIFTSREKPKGLAASEGHTLSLRFLQLEGLSNTAAKEFFQIKDASTQFNDQLSSIVENYIGNPFALKIVSSSINKLFDGDIYKFIKNIDKQPFIFDDIRTLLNEQISRLTDLQKIMMYWLSIIREPLTSDQLRGFFPFTILFDELLHGLESLKCHSLIKKTTDRFSLEPFIMDYTVNYFVEVVFKEITSENFFMLKKHLLTSDHLQLNEKQNQAKFFIRPLLKKLFLHFGSPKTTCNYLNKILDTPRIQSILESECINENIIHVKIYLEEFLQSLNQNKTNNDRISICNSFSI
jgi:NB-ARC domain